MHPVVKQLIAHPQTTVVTATRRLARRLLYEYNQQQRQLGAMVWPTPDILSWTPWWKKAWRQAVAINSQILISVVQELAIWQSIIEDNDSRWINHQAIAQQAMAAKYLIADSMLDMDDPQIATLWDSDADTRCFRAWYQQYRQRLADHQWLDEHDAQAQLIDAFIAGDILPPSSPIRLAGFDDMTYLQQRWSSWLEAHSLSIPNEPLALTRPAIELMPCADQSEEIYQAALWAREQFETNWQPEHQPIAVIFPYLEQHREQIERVFRDVFYPQDGLHTAQSVAMQRQGVRQDAVFNLSLGYGLIQEPLIRIAMDLLALSLPFDFECFSHCIRSSYIKNNIQRRAQLDIALRNRAPVKTTLEQVLQRWPLDHAPDLCQQFWQFRDLSREWDGPSDAAIWVDRFQQVLAIFAWPNLPNTHGHEDQVLNSLADVWFEFARLEMVSQPMGLSQALAALNQILQKQIFQPGKDELPVQILGKTEAKGMYFSTLWVAGMTEQAWPPPAKPNPFIPMRVQHQFNLPHHSPEYQLVHARTQTQRWLQAAPNVHFSYPCFESDQPVLPSALVQVPGHIVTSPVHRSNDCLPGQYEQWIDDHAPPVDAGQCQAHSAVFRDQSHCPFRAFVYHRLHATPLATPQPGVDPAIRGIAIHQVMERLWSQWGTSSHLHTQAGDVLLQQVDAAVEAVLSQYPIDINQSVERIYLTELIRDWIEIEKTRAPFEVAKVEQAITTRVGGLTLRLRIDRIDRLADGSYLLIDYKTGVSQPKQWLGERPEEPQLPLYAVAFAKPLGGVVLAVIRTDSLMGYTGVGDDQDQVVDAGKLMPQFHQIPVSKGAFKELSDWSALQNQWREVVEQLAKAYLRGEAQVDPKSATSCRYCAAKPACRIFAKDQDG